MEHWQILTFSHQSEYEKKPLKLRSIIIEVLDLIRVSIPPSIDIKKDLQSHSHVLADQTQIHQVIMNLCTNACYAMKENGGTLGITLADVDIFPEDQGASGELSPGRYVMLTIQDTGCGIRPELIEKIFDPYFTTKEKDKGTGLGLSVVHGIVAKSKGHIAINSQLGKGSEFSVYLPLFGVPGKPMAEKEYLRVGNNERILCSGYSDDIDVAQLKKMGITQYLMKPIGIKDLAREIKWALSKSVPGKLVPGESDGKRFI